MSHREPVKRVAWGRFGLVGLAGLNLLGVLLPAVSSSGEAVTVDPAETTEATEAPPVEPVEPVEPEKPIPGKSDYARRIAARNAFGLVDPAPPPPPPPEPTPPPVPPKLNTVQLTGFSRWAGERKVYLVVTKQGAKAPDYMDLREGDERSEIRVVSIDDKNETAVIVNAGTEQTLNFKDNGMKPAAGPVLVPGAPPVPNQQPIRVAGVQPIPPPPVTMANRFGPSGPTVVGRGGVVDSSVAVPAPVDFGGQPQPTLGNQFQPIAPPGGVFPGVPSSGLPASMGQNPSINRSRVFNIPPPPLPPVDPVPGQ